MGWTSYTADHYKNNMVDRVKECESILTSESETGIKWQPLKISAKGSTVYAAVKRTEPDGHFNIYAEVILTKVSMKHWDNFCYKEIDETSGPCERNCPVSILKLLTPTDNETANKWRNDCYLNAEMEATRRKDENALNNLPVGSTVEFHIGEETIRVTKINVAYRKRPIWYDGFRYRYRPSLINGCGYTVIKRG